MSVVEPVLEDRRPDPVLDEEPTGPVGPQSPFDRPGDHELGSWSESGAEPFGDWRLPGKGESAPTCGEVSATSFCDEAGHIHYESHLCGRRECPVCWNGQWAGPRTVSVVSRLAAARHSEPEGIQRRTIHAVVSPPEDSIQSIESVYLGRREALAIAKDHGIRGGVVIFHGYRPTQATKDRYEDVGPGLPIWRWIRSNEERWKDQVYWSPHYHVVGLSVDTDPGDSNQDGGWVFKNIRSLEAYTGPRDREGTEDMVRVVRYLLSHATFPDVENRQAVSWFGELHGTNFDPEEDISGGSWSVIERVTEEVVGSEGEESERAEDRDVCPVEGCEGGVHSIYHVRDFLETSGHSLPRETRARLKVAYEWVSGFIEPPPGLKNPRSVEHAEEALEAMLQS